MHDDFGFPLSPAAKDASGRHQWQRSSHRAVVLVSVAKAGGWAGYLWPPSLPAAPGWECGSGTDWEGYGDESYYPSLKWMTDLCSTLPQVSAATLRTFREIERDMPRTCPGHADEAELMQKTSRILRAYAVRNPAVGYCQGMNKIAAVLASAVPEDRAFWFLALMVERVVPDYYRGLEGAVVDLQLLDSMVADTEPVLFQHLQEIGFCCSVVFTQTLVCVFSACLPTEATLRLWRGIFAAKSPRLHLLRLTCSLICLLKGELLSAADMPAAVDCFRYQSSGLYDAGRLEAVADAMQGTFVDAELELRRSEIAEAVQRESAAMRSAWCSSSQQPGGGGCVRPTRRLLKRIRAVWQRSFDCSISRGVFEALLRRAGARVEGHDAGAIFDKWDPDGTGEAPMLELLVGMALLVEGSLSDRLRSVCGILADARGRPDLATPAIPAAAAESWASDDDLSDVDGEVEEEAEVSSELIINKRAFGVLVSAASHAVSRREMPHPDSAELQTPRLSLSIRGAQMAPISESPRRRETSHDIPDDAMSVAESVFHQLDTDGDGQLSVVELVRAVPQLSLALSALRDTQQQDARLLRPKLQPDGEAASCNLCGKEWRLWRRRHHCRYCGVLACDNCSSHRSPLPQLGYTASVRICDRCHDTLSPSPRRPPGVVRRSSAIPAGLVVPMDGGLGSRMRSNSAGRTRSSSGSGRPQGSSGHSRRPRGTVTTPVSPREDAFSDAFIRAHVEAAERDERERVVVAPEAAARDSIWQQLERCGAGVSSASIALVVVAAAAGAQGVARRRRRLTFTSKLRTSLSKTSWRSETSASNVTSSCGSVALGSSSMYSPGQESLSPERLEQGDELCKGLKMYLAQNSPSPPPAPDQRASPQRDSSYCRTENSTHGVT